MSTTNNDFNNYHTICIFYKISNDDDVIQYLFHVRFSPVVYKVSFFIIVWIWIQTRSICLNFLVEQIVGTSEFLNFYLKVLLLNFLWCSVELEDFCCSYDTVHVKTYWLALFTVMRIWAHPRSIAQLRF